VLSAIGIGDRMDVFSPQERSRIMRRVRSVDTKPELIVRRLLHRLGCRFRLHDKSLPGCPDIKLTRHKMVIFVHGCFWHGHDCKRGARVPASNADYWIRKIQSNIERDKLHLYALTMAGWRVMVVWECQTVNDQALEDLLREHLLKSTA